jgi:hypothetical protein
MPASFSNHQTTRGPYLARSAFAISSILKSRCPIDSRNSVTSRIAVRVSAMRPASVLAV